MDQVLPNVAIPVSMLRRPGKFGGRRIGDCLVGDLRFRSGQVNGLMATESEPEHMVLQRLTECHVHLDKCHTIHRMEGIGGDLRSAISAQAKDRMEWNEADIRSRGMRGFDELQAAGCGTVRSHVDWGHGSEALSAPLAWHVLQDLAADSRDTTLQIAALCGSDDLAEEEIANGIGQILKGRGVLGAFILDQTTRREAIRNAFRVALENDLPLDFHADEGLSEGLDGLELIAKEAIRTGFEGPVLVGHACAMINQTGDDLRKTLDLVLESGIAIVSLPTTNLYLQGRTAGTPNRRGVTRIKEFAEAGIPIAIGTDNVRDAFCPLGRFDPRVSLSTAALAGHLDPPFGDHLSMISTSAAAAIGTEPLFIDDAKAHDLIVFESKTTADLLSDPTPPRPLQDLLDGKAQ